MPAIKKIGNIVFTILNTIIIISLLVFSSILIMSVNTNSPSILGFSSKLIYDQNYDSAMLVVSQTVSKLSPKDEFVYQAMDGVAIYTVDAFEGNVITYSGFDNTVTSMLPTTSPEYAGKILVKNAQIGDMLATLVKTESMSVIYVLIIGTFSLLLLLLFLIHYLFKNKDKLVEYYEEEVDELVDENGDPIELIETSTKPKKKAKKQKSEELELDAEEQPQTQTMAEAFDEMPEMVVKSDRKSKKKKKKSKSKDDSDVLDLIDGIEKNPKSTTEPPRLDKRTQLSTPKNTRGKRAALGGGSASASGMSSFDFPDDNTDLDDIADGTGYSEDDILAVITEPNATFIVDTDEDEDYYEDGNVKYFSNGIAKPTLQESLMAYVHTNSDVDPEPPLPVIQTNDGIPIEWFESIMEVASTDPSLPDVLLEDFEIKPVMLEKPVNSTRDIIERVEEMSTFKRKHPQPKVEVEENPNIPPPPVKPASEKPSADALLQEIDSIFQKPTQQVPAIPPAPTIPEPVQVPVLEEDGVQSQQQAEPQMFVPQSFDAPSFDDQADGQISEDDILNEIKEQFG